MNDLVIVGAGDHARVARETAEAAGWRLVAVVEPRADAVPPSFGTALVTGNLAAAVAGGRWFVAAVGSNRARRQLFEAAIAAGGRPATLVHPRALLLGGAAVGEGSHICAAAVVGVDARVGRNVIVNTGAVIDHDDLVEAHAFVGPGAKLGGRVVVGEGAHVGLGSVVVEGRKIGAWSFVAAGATVIRDVGPSQRVAGVPARPMDDPHREGA